MRIDVSRSLPLLIGGERVEGDAVTPLIDPVNGLVAGNAAAASIGQLDAAVAAARESFASGRWSRATPADRAAVLTRMADLLEQRADEFARTESRNTGKPLKFSTGFDVPLTIDNLRFFAAAGRNLEGRASGEYMPGYTSSIRREPLGVVASIAPWNYPLNMAGWKIGPALAAGNSVVLKPAELTPTTSLMLGELALEAGLPEGTLNVVTGRGSELGTGLASHPDVALVSVTGSTATGRSVMRAAAEGTKRVHLELGGKAPFLVFEDAHLAAAIEGAVVGAYANSGQDCTAATRIYVHRRVHDEFLEGLVQRAGDLIVGDPFDASTDLGPLISERHLENVAGYVDRARADGAEVPLGGTRSDCEGWFYPPTIVTNVAQGSEIVQSEVFGPVVCVLPFDDDDEAFALANDTAFGIAASAWTRDVFRAQRATRELQAGAVWINEHIAICSEMPHGGIKASGFGKDMSMYALEEYTNVKHVMYELWDEPRKDWYDAVS